jgi:CheY-like chemotaxis protein
LAKSRSICKLGDNFWNGSDLINTLTNKAGWFIFSYSPQYKSLISWSPNALEVLGAKDTDIARDGNLFLRYLHPDDRFELLTDLEKCLRGEKEYRATYRWIRPDTDQMRWLHCRASLETHEDIDLFEGGIIDLSRELETYGGLSASGSLESILDAFSHYVIILDKDLRILNIIQPEGIPAFNFEDDQFRLDSLHTGKSLLDCFSNSELRDRYKIVLNQILVQKQDSFQTRVFNEDAVYNLNITPLRQDATVIGLVIRVSEISDRVRLEEEIDQLRQSEGSRLIATGAAYSFRNCLQGIIGQATAIQNHPENIEIVSHCSTAIIDSASQAARLTALLCANRYSRNQFLGPVDLNLAVLNAVNNIEDLFASEKKLGLMLGTPKLVIAKENKLISIIEALLRYFRELPRNCEKIAVKTLNALTGPAHPEAPRAANYSKLIISTKTAPLSAGEIQRQIEGLSLGPFESQQSGKFLPSKGAKHFSFQNFLNEIDGEIRVENNSLIGCRVTLWIPSEKREKSLTVSLPASTSAPKKPEILVIDHNQEILETMQIILSDLGHSTLISNNPDEALELVKEHGKGLKVIFIEAFMPETNGASVIRRVKKLHKDIIVICFSSILPEATGSMLKAGADQTILKPVKMDVIERVLKQVLQKSEAA